MAAAAAVARVPAGRTTPHCRIGGIPHEYQKHKTVLTPVASPPPKVRVQYYSVGDHALSFLMLGMLDPALQKHLVGKPIVWQNQVYHSCARCTIDSPLQWVCMAWIKDQLKGYYVPEPVAAPARKLSLVLKPLAATEWGTKDFYVEDPDGYIIAFGGRPAEE